MAQETRIDFSEVVRHFESLGAPRSSINRLHPLNSVVVISLMPVPGGTDGADDHPQVGRIETRSVVHVFSLPDGLPSKDVFRRVLISLCPSHFSIVFYRLAEFAACGSRY